MGMVRGTGKDDDGACFRAADAVHHGGDVEVGEGEGNVAAFASEGGGVGVEGGLVVGGLVWGGGLVGHGSGDDVVGEALGEALDDECSWREMEMEMRKGAVKMGGEARPWTLVWESYQSWLNQTVEWKS